MSTDLREEMKAFERDLAVLVGKFLKIYQRLEMEVRPEARAQPPAPLLLRPIEPPALPGYH